MVSTSLLWRCRRGIREMDLLLQRFVELQYEHLSENEQSVFMELLDETDLDIMDWIMQRQETPGIYENLISLIRQTNQSSPIKPSAN